MDISTKTQFKYTQIEIGLKIVLKSIGLQQVRKTNLNRENYKS